jgi:uncharacterized membrane protein
MTKREAEARIKRIFAFRDELSVLEQEDVLELSPADRSAVAAYHDRLLGGYARRYDADLTKSESQLSWGMRIASTLGAVAFALGVFLFFEYYWDLFSTTLQVALLTVAPFLGWALSEFVARRFKTTHYTSLAVLVAVACFVADLFIVGRIFNVTPSPNALLAWGLFGLVLAYRHELAVVMGLCLLALMTFAGGFLTNLAGFAWPRVQIPEFYLGAGILCLAIPLVIRRPAIDRYRPVYLFVGLLQIYGVLNWLVLSQSQSLLPLSASATEWLYLVLAFIAGGVAIRQCIRSEWAAGTYLSAVFLVVLMLHKYHDWFWDDLPHFVFFLVLGVIAVAIIASLRKMRSVLREAEQ